jgi:hypothetical protein
MANVTASLTAIIDHLQAALPDAEKADKGNKSAGTRVRGAAQEAKHALTELRSAVLAARDND